MWWTLIDWSMWWHKVTTVGRHTLTLLRWNPLDYDNCPLAELEWDPGDFRWKHNNRLCHFFDYNIKFGQPIQLQWKVPCAMVGEHWASITRCFAHSRRVSSVLHMAEKIKIFWFSHILELARGWFPIFIYIYKPPSSSPVFSVKHPATGTWEHKIWWSDALFWSNPLPLP